MSLKYDILEEGECIEEIEQAFETLQHISASAEFSNQVEAIGNARKEQAVKERIAIEKAAQELAAQQAKAEEEPGNKKKLVQKKIEMTKEFFENGFIRRTNRPRK